jgi:triacylglycerol lipase
MSIARLPRGEGPPPGRTPAPAPKPRLHIEDALASPRRLWLRGYAEGLAGPVRAWWGRPGAQPPRVARLETQAGGAGAVADVALAEDGRFEALLAVELPPARRGWRIARNKLTFGGDSAEACAVVLLPPADAAEALVVLLPPACAFGEDVSPQLTRLDGASCVGPLLHELSRGEGSPRPVYYLACVPAGSRDRQRDVALTVASLGWPAGQVVALPAAAPSDATLAEGLDRLRWLFAGSLGLAVLNLGPGAAPNVESAADRAAVRLAAPGDRPRGATVAGGQGPRPSRSGRVTRHPLVFCHGMLAFSTLRMQMRDDWNSFTALRRPLRERGFRALFPQVGPTSGIVARAAELRDQICRWTDEPVNLIAHSMGGLDARYLITHLGMAGRVASLTTVGTAHRGTWLADWFIGNYRHRVPLLLAMEAFGINVDGFADCRPAACAAFNARTPDAPGVAYFSFGGAVPHCRVSPILRRPWCLLGPVEGPNDGMVSVASARWGEYLGDVEADHFAQTPDAVFLRPGEDFDALGFYMRLVEDLAYRGL